MRINLSSLGDMDCSSGVCFDNSQVAITPVLPSQAVTDLAMSQQLPVMSPGYSAGVALDQPNMTAAQIAALPGNPPASTTTIATLAVAAAVILGIGIFGGRR